jgi:hypothetical protein
VEIACGFLSGSFEFKFSFRSISGILSENFRGYVPGGNCSQVMARVFPSIARWGDKAMARESYTTFVV